MYIFYYSIYLRASEIHDIENNRPTNIDVIPQSLCKRERVEAYRNQKSKVFGAKILFFGAKMIFVGAKTLMLQDLVRNQDLGCNMFEELMILTIC